MGELASGKRLHNELENHHFRFLTGKLTISMAMFNSYVKLPEGNLSQLQLTRWMDCSRPEKKEGLFEKVVIYLRRLEI